MRNLETQDVAALKFEALGFAAPGFATQRVF